jgi:CDP-diacylglycerol pyrophosphatase
MARTVAADPNALWAIVNDHCVPNEREHGKPDPCARVDLDEGAGKGYVILKDLEGATQYLLIPTARITGIENPELLEPDAPNYFAEAWEARGYVEQAAHRQLPREDLSLAINSTHARSQNQLHIHIDCTRIGVRDLMRRRLASIGDDWAPFAEPLRNHHYRAMRVLSEDLGGINPFRLVADRVPGAKAAMGDQTIVLLGADFPGGRPGFVVLNDQIDPATGDKAGGEELQDHACALARS